MKKTTFLIRAAGTLACTVVAAGLVAQPPGFDMAKNVQTGFVQQGGMIQPLRLTGTVEAIIDTRLASEQRGAIEQLFVEEGDTVTTGTVLLTLRREPLRLARDASMAALGAEKARLLELRTGNRPEDITIAVQAYEEARIAFETAQRDFLRFEALFESRSVSEAEFDQTRRVFDASRARMESTRAAKELAEQGPRAEEIAAQEARVAALEAEAALRADDYERAEIRSPLAGVVTRRHVDVGTWVSDGDAVLDLVSLDRLRVRALVPEQEFASIRPGASAILTFDSAPGMRHEYPVSRVISRADVLNRTFPILINIGNPEGSVAPGMLARVEFRREVDGGTKLVPKDALVPQGPVPVLFKVEYVDGQPIAKRLEVQTGRFFGQAVEVLTEELRAGDQVIIRGNERLQDGDKLSLNTFVTNPGRYVADRSKFFTEE